MRMDYLCVFYSLFAVLMLVYGKRVPDKKLCADARCETPISEAYTLIRYGSDHPKILSFKAKEPVLVYGRASAGKVELLDVKINNKRGYAPKGLIRETKVLVNAKYVSHVVLTGDDGETQLLNKSSGPETHQKTSEQTKDTDSQQSEVEAKDQGSPSTVQYSKLVYSAEPVEDTTLYHNATPGLDDSPGTVLDAPDNQTVEDTTLYHNATPGLDDSPGTVLDAPDNQTDPLTSATSPTIQHSGTVSHHMLYSTGSHFQRKLHAIDGSEEIEDKSEELSDGSIEAKDQSPSGVTQLTGTEHVMKAAASTGLNERSDREQALAENNDFSEDTSSKEADGITKYSESEPVIPDKETVTTEKQEDGSKVKIGREKLNVDLSNETVLQSPQHNYSEFAMETNSSKSSADNVEANSAIPGGTEIDKKEQEAQMSSSSADHNTQEELHNILDHQNVFLPKDSENQPPLPGHPSSVEADESSSLNSNMNDSEISGQNIDIENKAAGEESPEIAKDTTYNSERSDAETQNSQVTLSNSTEGDNYDSSQAFATSEASPNEIEDEKLSKLSEDDITEDSTNVNITHIAGELDSGAGEIAQKSDDLVSYNSENTSSEEEEEEADGDEEEEEEEEEEEGEGENVSEDEASKLPTTSELYGADFPVEKETTSSEDLSVTENSISSEPHSAYHLQDEGSEMMAGFSDHTEATVSAESQDIKIQETSASEETFKAEDIKDEGFFVGLSDSVLSTLSSISNLGFGSSVAEEEKEADVVSHSKEFVGEDMQNKEKLTSEDVVQPPSPWGRDHSLKEAAHHVATDPDQTGHKVDVDVPAGNDLSEISYQSSVCETGINCGGQSGLIPSEPQLQESSMSEDKTEDIHRSDATGKLYDALSDNALYMMITAAVTGCVLALTVMVSHFLQKPRYISLTSNIFKLEKQLLCLKTENSSLKEELQKKEEELSSVQTSSCDSDKVVMLLKSELETSQAARTELEEQVASLEKELEAATEAGLELNRMLSDFLSTQHGSETLVKSVEHLQRQLDAQQHTITEMNNNLSIKSQENENLQQELAAATEKLSVQDDELQKTTDSLLKIQKEKIDLMSEMEEKIKALQLQLSQITESTRSEISRLTTELDESRETVAMRDSELTVLQDCLRQLKAFEEGQGSEQLDTLLDVGHARAELALVSMDRDSLKDRLHDEEVARKLLEDHVKIIKEEVNTLRSKYEEAEKDKLEAQTRLEVLSNYFKEKETQLQKELGLQEAMYIQKEGDATSTYEKIKSLQEEIENYKSQNDTLKKEIIDQERSLKSQISTLEKKAHENWVAARQAERRLEESRQEAGQLRNRLTIVEKNLTNTSQNSSESGKVGDRLQAADSNGELPTSFLHMGMQEMQDPSFHQHRDRDGHPVSPPLIPGQPLHPFMGIPPPGVFMPPPPLPGAPFAPPPPPPLFPGDRRPPPLGRMSSPPPPPHRYSPEARGDFSPYDHSPPLSPHEYDDDDDSPPRRFHHRSPPPPPLAPYLPPPRQLSRWDDPHSGFRPLPPVHRESPRDSKGSALSSGHSSESLDKSSRHSGRV